MSAEGPITGKGESFPLADRQAAVIARDSYVRLVVSQLIKASETPIDHPVTDWDTEMRRHISEKYDEHELGPFSDRVVGLGIGLSYDIVSRPARINQPGAEASGKA